MSTEKGPGALASHSRTAVSACDTCKRRKVRCSGEQPCKRCHAGTIVCTYGHLIARVKPVEYIRHLEDRVAELEAQLNSSTLQCDTCAVGSVHLSDTKPQGGSSRVPPGALNPIDTLVGPDNDLLSSVEGLPTYHGEFASLNILRMVRDKCDSLVNIMAPLSSGRILAEAFAKDTGKVMPPAADLPELAECQRLCYVAIEEALPCHECIDREAFFAQLVRVHAKSLEDLDLNDRAFLALVLALLGFAERYEADSRSPTEAYSSGVAILKGWGFYQSSMEMLQLDDLCSLDMLRAIIYQVLFLAASCMLSKAYTRLSIGVATALRMGLHVSSPSLGPGLQFPAEHMFRRRQVFSLLYAIDTYLASTLGVPKLLHQVDTDQILPLRDADMHDHGISFARRNPHTPEAETLVSCRILIIMAEIHRRRVPFSEGMAINSNSRTYKLTRHEVASLDTQLTEWYNSLPPVGEIPPVKRALHAQLVIRHTYAITQMSLHRPFLHHMIRKAVDGSFCMDGYEYGSHCITAAMQSVWVLQRLDEQGLLHASIWFYISSLAFAASSLIFFVLGSPYSATVDDAKEAAFKAHGLLEKLGRKNEAAQHCFESIDSLMTQASLEVDKPNEAPRS